MAIDKNRLTPLRCTAVTKVDLHVHATGRNAPLTPVGSSRGRSAFPTIKRIFSEAQSRGMGFVTITEHNSMALSLLLKHLRPDEAFTGVEITTLFPEDGGRAHVLAYGIEEAEFKEIQHVRKDIYDLRDYMKERHIAYSVAHAVHWYCQPNCVNF
jgi:predicted metal-dependent phosphoesterase TrpH